MTTQTLINNRSKGTQTTPPTADNWVHEFYGLTPLKTGQRIPDFLTSDAQVPAWYSLHPYKLPKTDPLSSLELFAGNRPVVLIFRPIFQGNGSEQIAFLNTIRKDIQIMGGDVFVITGAGVGELSSYYGSHPPFQFLSDPNNTIAQAFGLHRPDTPLANWLSGIEGDISLPAFYVIEPSGYINHHYIDYHFRTYQWDETQKEPSFVRDLLTKVYQNAQKSTRKKKAAFGT